MTWGRLVRGVGRLGAAGLALLGVARAEDVAGTPRTEFDDTGRFYFAVETGLYFMFDHHFAGDVRVDPPSGVDNNLGGMFGYNIGRHWGAELQVDGIDPDLVSSNRGTIREFSVMTIVPAVRYRWHLDDDRLVPYLTGGLGLSVQDVHDEPRKYAKAKTDDTTIVGSLSAGFDYFLSPNVAAGLDLRSLIYPNQDAEVTYQDPRTLRITRYTDSLNLSALSLMVHLRVFPGQQAGADGRERHFLLADHGPFETSDRRIYLSGLFGYDFLADNDAGSGVRLRDKGGDANLTKGGALGFNLDGNWGAEVQLLATSFNVRQDDGAPKFAKLNILEVIPTVRYRYPLLHGRLVPFATAGIGASYLFGNDQRALFESQPGVGQVVKYPRFQTESPALVGTVGAGLEYFLNRHLSAGLAIPYRFYSDVDTKLVETGHKTQSGSANLSGLLVLLQLKAYLN